MISPAYNKGLLLYRQRRFRMAAEQFRQAILDDQRSVQAHAMLGLSLLYDKQEQAAHAAVAHALSLDPHVAFAHYAMACVIINQPIKHRQFLGLRSSTRSSIRKQARRRGVLAKAEAIEATRLDPHKADCWAMLSYIEQQLGRWQDGVVAAERGLQVDPHHAGCANLRAQALGLLGRLDEACAQTTASLRQNPQDSESHRNRGWVLLRQGDVAAAREHFEQSLRINPESTSAQKGLRWARRAKFPPYRIWLQNRLWMYTAMRNVWTAVPLCLSFIAALVIIITMNWWHVSNVFGVDFLMVYVAFQIWIFIVRTIAGQCSAWKNRRKLPAAWTPEQL